MGDPTTINLGLINEGRQPIEAVCVGTPMPGYLAELTATGTIQAHSTAGGISQKLFFWENQANAGLISDAYAAGDTARAFFAWGSDSVYAFIADAVACTANTTMLVSNGDGTLKAAAGTEIDEQVIAMALETVTASGETRIRVRVL